jgi:hypothetical protein
MRKVAAAARAPWRRVMIEDGVWEVLAAGAVGRAGREAEAAGQAWMMDSRTVALYRRRWRREKGRKFHGKPRRWTSR